MFTLADEDDIYQMSPISASANVSLYGLATSGGFRMVIFDENTYVIGEVDESYLTDYTIRSFVNLGNGLIAVAVMYEEDSNI
jgi:hypothetical protein